MSPGGNSSSGISLAKSKTRQKEDIIRILLIAPNDPTINSIPEIRSISSKHHATILNGNVTLQTIDQYVRQGFNIIHFAGHSNHEGVQLSDDTMIEADDLVRIAHMAGANLIFLNSCSASRLAAYAVSHGINYVICSTIELNDKEAWEFPSAFYTEVNNGSWPDIYKAFRTADNSNGEYAIFISPTLYTDCHETLSEVLIRVKDTIIVHPRTLFLVATLTLLGLFVFGLILVALSGRPIA